MYTNCNRVVYYIKFNALNTLSSETWLLTEHTSYSCHSYSSYIAHELTVSEEGLVLIKLHTALHHAVAIATATPPYDTPTQLPSARPHHHNHQCMRSDKCTWARYNDIHLKYSTVIRSIIIIIQVKLERKITCSYILISQGCIQKEGGGGHWDTAQIILSKKTLFAITAFVYDLQYIY